MATRQPTTGGGVSTEPEPGAKLVFVSAGGIEVAARLVSAEVRTLVVDVEPGDWGAIDELGLFGLEPEHRLPGRVSGERPVRIELQPLGESSSSVLGEGAALVGADGRSDLDRWHALAVTESIRQEGSVELRSGFATRWRDGRAVNPLLDEICGFFTDRDVPIDRTDGPEPALFGDGDGAHGAWLLTVRAEPASRAVILESVSEALSPTARARLVASLPGDGEDARVEDGRLVVVDHWQATPGALDEEAFGGALASHLRRMDDLLGMAAAAG